MSALNEAAAASAATAVDVEGRTYFVQPPTVRQYCEIHARIAGVAAGHLDDAAGLERDLEAWLGPELLESVADLPDAGFYRAVLSLLEAGTPERREPKTRGGEDGGAEKEKRELDLFLVLGEYVAIYGGTIWDVYDRTPWPWFVEALARRSAASARELLRWAEIEILPHTGKASKKLITALQGRTRHRKAHDAEPAYAPPEVIQRDRALLRQAMGAPPVPAEPAP